MPPFKPLEINNEYERAFKTWRWINDNYGDFHPSDHEEVAKDLMENYEKMEEAFIKAELFDFVKTFFKKIDSSTQTVKVEEEK